MQYKPRNGGALSAAIYDNRRPRQRRNQPRTALVIAPARQGTGAQRLASHGFVLSVALVAVIASGFGLPRIIPGAAAPAPLELPAWPQTTRSALPLDRDQQNVQKATVPVTETAASAAAGTQTARLAAARTGIVTYTVKEGDTLSDIAARYNVTTQTLVWANESISPHDLKLGQEVRVPPTSGVLHKVKDGETLNGIAHKYKVEPAEITSYANNELLDPNSLAAGQEIMVVGGIKPAEPAVQVAARQPESQPAAARGEVLPPSPQAPVGGASLQWPTYGPIYSFFSGWHRGLDISPPHGTPVYAAEAGVVTAASYQNDGYGLTVHVDHGNGLQSMYAHLSEVVVRPGESVVRGQHVGRVGTSGRVTGPHLHFEVYQGGVAIDPLRMLPR